ncbi:MAG: hypothetical protein ACR2HA_05155 [Nocardioides sp.]
MITLSAWLLVVGLCDLLRATQDTISPRHRWVLVALGLSLLLFVGVWLDLPVRGWTTVGITWVVGLVGWLVCSSAALDPSSGHRPRWRALAFTAVVVPGVLLALLGDAVPVSVGLPELVDDSLLGRAGPEAGLLLGGALLAQISTANVAVRLLLDAVGVPAVSNEKLLKGGRALGPMERIFIIGLGLAGSLGAAAVVVAAKALLRYPELQRTEREEGPTDVSEYFLIGSFSSWLLALAGLGVFVLGR